MAATRDRSYLTGPEICARYDISPTTIRRWVDDYGMPAYKAGGRWRLDRDEALVWEIRTGIRPVGQAA